MTAAGTMRGITSTADHMADEYTRDEITRAWRAVAAGYAARLTGLPVQGWRKYDGPIDVQSFVDGAPVPADTTDRHANDRAFRDLRAAFHLRYGGDLLATEAA